MKTLTLLCFFVFTLAQAANPKEVALSFDDCPRSLTGHFGGMERAQQLVKHLQEGSVKDAVFFCNSKSINTDTEKRIQLFNDSGFSIANHTHSHPSFNDETFESYYGDFLKADEILSKYSQFKKLFRYPMLKEGNEIAKRDQMREALKKHGYKNAYITVDFSDWHLESLFKESLKNNQSVDLKRLGELYISLAKESFEHYDALAVKYLGRSPKHVLLLHETDLAALFLGDLLKAMKTWNWKVISSDVAYSDEISKFTLQRALKYNPGRIGEIALERGHPIEEIWAQSTEREYINTRYQHEVLGITKSKSSLTR